MTGGWHHVTEDGSLHSRPMILHMLDSTDDVMECIEQMFGMIHCLAYDLATTKQDDPSPQQVMTEIDWSLVNYQDGIDMGGRVGRE